MGAAAFAYATYINPDTEFLNAKANERYLEYFSAAVEQAKTYEGEQLTPTTARALQLLKLGVAAPAPKDPVKRSELAALASKMQGVSASALTEYFAPLLAWLNAQNEGQQCGW